MSEPAATKVPCHVHMHMHIHSVMGLTVQKKGFQKGSRYEKNEKKMKKWKKKKKNKKNEKKMKKWKKNEKKMKPFKPLQLNMCFNASTLVLPEATFWWP